MTETESDGGGVERERDTDTGQYTSKVEPGDIYDALTPGRPYTAREVADEFGLSRQHACDLLRDLARQTDVVRVEHSQRVITYHQPLVPPEARERVERYAARHDTPFQRALVEVIETGVNHATDSDQLPVTPDE